jgi:hypothetical protein
MSMFPFHNLAFTCWLVKVDPCMKIVLMTSAVTKVSSEEDSDWNIIVNQTPFEYQESSLRSTKVQIVTIQQKAVSFSRNNRIYSVPR